MVNRIYELKNKVLERIDHEVAENGIERMDVQEMGMMVDMVKDLAEAEKSCWEADYYRSVTEAMEGGRGYMPMSDGYQYQPSGYQPSANGYQGNGYQGTASGRSGWQSQYGSGRTRRGYDMPSGYAAVDGLKQAMQSATPEERERMKRELSSMMNGAM